MKSLLLSDLDGTLLRSDRTISNYTAETINRFVKDGGCFSYATSRSISTVIKMTAKINITIPVICCNGAFIIENINNKILLSNFFIKKEVDYVQKSLSEHNIYPIVNAYIDGSERFTYAAPYVTLEMQPFLDIRREDPRRRVVEVVEKLYMGDVFRFTCIGKKRVLSPVESIFSTDNRFACIYQKEIYSGEQSCEILPAKATKANAALQLKSMLGCDEIVAFGDESNDISMFSVADKKYAVSNAVQELKEIATEVIESNDHDGVARWINKNYYSEN